ncbi:MAG: type I glutamate--ammonia ligase [Candidatus Binatia bacterium]
MEAKEVLEFAKRSGAQIVDLKFMDLLGMWQHFSIPISELSEEGLEEGIGFDGSSIRGWQEIHLSDMLVVPDLSTAVMDPFTQIPTLTFICNVIDPITREPYTRDPRFISQKAEAFLRGTGIGEAVYFGPEAEFFVLDDIRFDEGSNFSFYRVDSKEGRWNTGKEEAPNLAYKPGYKQGYFPVPPSDSLHDLRSEMVKVMEQAGIKVECHHHEVATGGQGEIDMKFDSLTRMADKLMWYKYITKNVARRHGKAVTFMPKPIFGDNASGMHIHQSLWKNGQPLFAGEEYGGLSKLALHYIGGILKHGPALCALVAPTTNSYKRLVPGFEAPVNLTYSSRNRSAGVRIPMYHPSPKTKRIEVRFPDPSCNPYLAFSALLMAGLDGIESKADPGESLDKDIYSLTPEELSGVPTTPSSLEQALNALSQDHGFLMKGDVFTPDVIDKWIEYKTTQEVDAIKMRPTPLEFALYFDC